MAAEGGAKESRAGAIGPWRISGRSRGPTPARGALRPDGIAWSTSSRGGFDGASMFRPF